ncbi:MAG: hypothetical protein FWG84_04550 [Bacteroidales bacterium]|nr:hypothetical protein [Bacteroidales bacterium]
MAISNQTLQTLAKPQKVYLENTNIGSSVFCIKSNLIEIENFFLPLPKL